jgi:hypothetical protein
MHHFLDRFQFILKLDYEDTDMRRLAMGLVLAGAVGQLHGEVSAVSEA